MNTVFQILLKLLHNVVMCIKNQLPYIIREAAAFQLTAGKYWGKEDVQDFMRYYS